MGYMAEKITTVSLTNKTKERLIKKGKMGESMDTLLNRLMDRLEGK